MQSYDNKLVSHAEDSWKELHFIFQHRVNVKHEEKYEQNVARRSIRFSSRQTVIRLVTSNFPLRIDWRVKTNFILPLPTDRMDSSTSMDVKQIQKASIPLAGPEDHGFLDAAALGWSGP
jgi:hypothetical protein